MSVLNTNNNHNNYPKCITERQDQEDYLIVIGVWFFLVNILFVFLLAMAQIERQAMIYLTIYLVKAWIEVYTFNLQLYSSFTPIDNGSWRCKQRPDGIKDSWVSCAVWCMAANCEAFNVEDDTCDICSSWPGFSSNAPQPLLFTIMFGM